MRSQVQSAQRMKRVEEARADRAREGAEAEAEAEAVHTVAFVMSNGDNLQWMQNDWREEQWYGAKERGAVPIGWTVPAAAAQLLPTILSWLTREATANDTFIAGPSGAGYAFAEQLPGARAAPFAAATAQLMAQAGLRIVNVIGGAPTAESLQHLLEQPNIDAAFCWTYDHDYSGLGGNVAYVNGKPSHRRPAIAVGRRQRGDSAGAACARCEPRHSAQGPDRPELVLACARARLVAQLLLRGGCGAAAAGARRLRGRLARGARQAPGASHGAAAAVPDAERQLRPDLPRLLARRKRQLRADVRRLRDQRAGARGGLVRSGSMCEAQP